MQRSTRPYPKFATALRRYYRQGELPEPKLYRWARGDFGKTNALTWLTERPDAIKALYEDVTGKDMLPPCEG